MAERVGVYPGTFDPITTGHLDIIHRAVRIVDRLIIGVARNAGKGPLFTLEQRVAQVEGEIAEFNPPGQPPRVVVKSFSSLLIQFAKENQATLILRGLRAVSDFEYEFQMAGMNAKLDTHIDTVFLMAADGQQFVSSRFVKEIGKLGGDISRFVSPRIVDALAQRFADDAARNADTSRQTPPFG